ncbi:KDO2-lipid IV(A) lauroyltransferase [Atopomonas hussainii]|uniref:KDO2-lipid IV(A) lauroyltransferase n=1 Tax=Atopomonas hussainii TaxID=1429083 RepID=A0A1H7F2M2_9GAMM|nr:lysophospholipid acyltransferase [Atopomonas hussainii]SEK20238.1 KDO2-lipid IV(A) lauroyltransferase [Atopomonas hussainii]
MDAFKGAVVVALLKLFALLPWPAVKALGGLIGWLLWRVPNRSREVVHINLQACFPNMPAAEREQLAQRSLKHIGHTITEAASAWMWPAERTLKLIREVENEALFDQAIASGKPLVLITSHLGNWEVLNQYAASKCKTIILYRPSKLEVVNKLITERRSQQGNPLVPSTREGILKLVKGLREGGVAGIAADPEPSVSSGEFVPFFGVPTLTSKFVPSLVVGGKAQAIVLHALRLDDGSGFKVVIEPAPEDLFAEDVPTAVTALSAAMERSVARYPNQYMWSMKRFKKRPEGMPKLY